MQIKIIGYSSLELISISPFIPGDTEEFYGLTDSAQILQTHPRDYRGIVNLHESSDDSSFEINVKKSFYFISPPSPSFSFTE